MNHRWISHFLRLNLLLLFATTLLFRILHLDHIPGINGDEAWYGVQAMSCVMGEHVEGRTPSGWLLNPLLLGIELPLLLIFEPSFWILRVPSVLFGVLAVVMTYVLGSRVLDRLTAMIATILLSTLPIAIGYSRFGWESSQTPFFSLLAIYFALKGNALGLALSMVIALGVHLTNIFLLPILLPPFLVVSLGRRTGDPKGQLLYLLTALSVAAAVVAAVGLATPRSSEADVARLYDVRGMLTFLRSCNSFFSGTTLYEYIVGPVSPGATRLHVGAFLCLTSAALGLGLLRLLCLKRWERVALVSGLALGAAAFYVKTGADSIFPHHERYGMFLVVPGILTLACLLRSLVPDSKDGWESAANQALIFAVSSLGWLLVFDFHHHYFSPLQATGGRSHRTFRTAEVEPKRQALALISADIAGRDAVPDLRAVQKSPWMIVAEDFWLSQPLQFLTRARKDVVVVDLVPSEKTSGHARRWLGERMEAGAYAVGFPGGAVENEVTSTFPRDSVLRWDVHDYSGRRVLTVYRLRNR